MKNHVGEKHGLECDAQNFSYAPTAGGTAKVSGDYLPDDELLKDGAALSLYVDKNQMERLEAVERSLAKRADQYGRKGFFCDCASLTKHERLVDAEMAEAAAGVPRERTILGGAVCENWTCKMQLIMSKDIYYV